MTTLTVTINEHSRQRYGVRGQHISFEDLRLRIISAEATTSLRNANRVARKTGLRKLTRKEIENEIVAVRNGSRRS